MDKIPLFAKIQILLVDFWINWLNFWLKIFKNILFFRKIKNPQNILIYKVGNIGDIICAIPSFIAIRRNYPNAKITLLTSPGAKGAIGAKELLSGVWYFDEMKIYYADEIDSLGKKRKFVKDLRGNNYDLFIQIPDDLANFRTLLRNIVFAKFIGIKSAFGFKIRTIQLFKKTQVDYLIKKNEVDNLLLILKENGIIPEKVEFDFNIGDEIKNRVSNLLIKNFGADYKNNLIIAISPAGKREANKWPVDRYRDLALYLKNHYNAKIIIIGGEKELDDSKIIKDGFSDNDVLVLTAKIELLETIELLRRCSFLVSNDTGTAHMAAAVSLPIVGIYGIRNVFGSWFPYGQNHKILYYKFINCDYRGEDCIKKSVELIVFEEVARACYSIIKKLNKN